MMFVKVEDCEIQKTDEETMRRIFENAKGKTNEPMEDDAESDEFRIELMADLQADNISLDKWNEIMRNELGVFKDDEKYDFVTDLRRQFDTSLATSRQDKIFQTIPAHYFWDIKKPLDQETKQTIRQNDINPTRQTSTSDFFDLRATEEWRVNRETKRDLN